MLFDLWNLNREHKMYRLYARFDITLTFIHHFLGRYLVLSMFLVFNKYT